MLTFQLGGFLRAPLEREAPGPEKTLDRPQTAFLMPREGRRSKRTLKRGKKTTFWRFTPHHLAIPVHHIS